MIFYSFLLFNPKHLHSHIQNLYHPAKLDNTMLSFCLDIPIRDILRYCFFTLKLKHSFFMMGDHVDVRP